METSWKGIETNEAERLKNGPQIHIAKLLYIMILYIVWTISDPFPLSRRTTQDLEIFYYSRPLLTTPDGLPGVF